MNIWGKVFAFFIIVLGGAAFVLLTQMLDFRQSWLKQVETNSKALATAREATKAKQKELATLSAEYDRLMLGWDTYINGVNASGDPAQGTLTLNVGPPQIAEKQDKDKKPVLPLVYAFQPGADGKYEYVGEFQAERLAAGNSTFKANWKIRPADSAKWKLGPNWRIRTRIPGADKVKFDELSIAFADTDERYAANMNELQRTKDEFAKKIKTALANRENELQGFKDYEADRGKLDDELVDGVLLTLVKEEEARNAALAQSDLLRHQLNATVLEFERLKNSNIKAAAGLPKGDTLPKEVSNRE